MSTDAERELAEKVLFLGRAGAYPEPTRCVEVIETHMSWVFLTDARAYKLKKPFPIRGSNHSTLEGRKRRCDEEVRLNRRLTEGVYLGVSPLLRDSGGYTLSAQILEPGEEVGPAVAEWLVTMRRLPRELNLEHRIESGLVTPEDLHAASRVLGQFYRRAERVPWTGEVYRRRLESEVIRYRRELDAPRFPLPTRDSLEAITRWQLAFLRTERALIESRAEERHIVDGHGDLRPEHIFLTPEPAIIDCLEFDRELRLLDAASELSFLALECTRLGAPERGAALFESYACVTGDAVPRRLVSFYESHHACVRAVVALWHLDDPTVNTRSKWVRKADRYLQLAAQLIKADGRQASFDPRRSR